MSAKPDLGAFLRTWGEPATYTPISGAPFEITGILETDPAKVPEGVWGVLWVRESDLPAEPQKNDAIRVAGVDCVLRNESFKHRDGAGGINLWLRKQ